jgi:hypothetical protein
MLNYCKLILDKVSFSPRLFWKEYRKSFRYLDPELHVEFAREVREQFKDRFKKAE